MHSCDSNPSSNKSSSAAFVTEHKVCIVNKIETLCCRLLCGDMCQLCSKRMWISSGEILTKKHQPYVLMNNINLQPQKNHLTPQRNAHALISPKSQATCLSLQRQRGRVITKCSKLGSTAVLVVSLACSIYSCNTLVEIQRENGQFKHEMWRCALKGSFCELLSNGFCLHFLTTSLKRVCLLMTDMLSEFPLTGFQSNRLSLCLNVLISHLII